MQNDSQILKPQAAPLMLGLAGFGTVGSGLIRILEENREAIIRRVGRDIRIKTILVRDPGKTRACAMPEGARFCCSREELLNDPEIEVVVELMGGLDAAGALIKAALAAGKHVVTANKALLAEAGNELFTLAQDKGLFLGYEASVCGGIPVVQALRSALSANEFSSLTGILNGTCNYIISSMTINGTSFDCALKQAQKLGFAEADPTLDIGGFDTAHKLILLVRLAWGVDYPYAALPVTGIQSISPDDIQYAREFNYTIKLLGRARRDANGRIEAGVFPAMVPTSYLLARVGSSYNAVRLEGNAVGSIFMHGKGAGDTPTGSAVAADIMEIARGDRPNNLGYNLRCLPPADIVPTEEAISSFYIRLRVQDRIGVMRDVATVLAEHRISIQQALQKGTDDIVSLIFMTHACKTKDVIGALAKLAALDFMGAEPVYYRVLPPPCGD